MASPRTTAQELGDTYLRYLQAMAARNAAQQAANALYEEFLKGVRAALKAVGKESGKVLVECGESKYIAEYDPDEAHVDQFDIKPIDA
jgi:hypothetical protein